MTREFPPRSEANIVNVAMGSHGRACVCKFESYAHCKLAKESGQCHALPSWFFREDVGLVQHAPGEFGDTSGVQWQCCINASSPELLDLLTSCC